MPVIVPTMAQAVKVSAAMTSTTGTKMLEMVSAKRWIGAFEPCACSTMRMIVARTVSAPTLVARIRRSPRWLMVAPISGSPSAFSMGMLSPVIIDSSTEERPDRTTPSTGIFSRANNHFIAHLHLLYGHLHFLPGAYDMSGTRLQADQFLDGLVGLPLGASLQVLTQEDQGHDQGGGIIEGDAANNLREEGRHDAHHVGCGRANRD